MAMKQGDARPATANRAALPQHHPPDLGFLEGGGEMSARMRDLDWSRTALGPIADWPQSLRTAVSICLRSRFPMIVWWGQDLTLIYNDAYAPMLGGKHPGALGQPGLSRFAWGEAEIRSVIEPMLRGVLERGDATWSDDQLLILERRGFPEEAYFTFSYSPIQDESGQVGGVFTAVTETTEKVIGQRRLGILRDLAGGALEAKTADEAYRRAAAILAQHPLDVPFFLLYALDDAGDVEGEGQNARLVGSSGLEQRPEARPETVSLLDAANTWPLERVAASGREVVVQDVVERFGELSGGPWPESPHTALVLPIMRPGQRVPYAELVAAISPRRPFDDDYTGFLRLAADQIATAISNVLAYEEERKRAEALAEIDRAKTAFFSNVSHEFRTPLTLLLGPLEDALRERETLPENRERLDVAHRNALRLLRLVNSLLDFSRIESGRLQASFEPTDLALLTTDLANGFRSAIERAGLRLVVDCPPLDQPVYVDHDLWEKIVLNLLSNAFKFTLEGQISVSLRRDREHGQVVLEVADTGVGIPERELPQIFERFHRVQGSDGRTHEGSGIGLSLVRELVELHGGEISVRSRPGAGSTFVVALPLGTHHLPPERISAPRGLASTAIGANAYVEEALRWLPGHAEPLDIFPDLPLASPLARPESWPMPGPLRSRQARILVADDNADMREYVVRLLRDRYQVEAVSDGEAALAAARRDPPDLVLTDVMMPRLDGFELLSALRADEATRDLPVIMLSARAGEESRIEGVQAGADDYLVKPFSARELLARVGAHLELAATRRQARLASEQERHRLYELFMQAPALIVVLRGPEHVFELANPLSARLLGVERAADVIGRRLVEVVPEIEQQGWLEVVDQIYRSGEPYTGNEMPIRFERPGEPKDERFFNFVALPYHDALGAVRGILVHAVDVTDQVRARQRVEEQNRVLELITRGAALGDALDLLARSIERQSGNRLRASILLLDRDGVHLRHGAAPSLPAAYNAAIDGLPIGPSAGSCGTAAYTRAPVVVSDIASDPLWRDYRDLAAEHGLRACWSTPIFSTGGEVLGTFAMYYDEPCVPSDDDRLLITFATRTAALLIERSRAEELRARLAAIVESSDDAIVSKDLNGVIMTWNAGAERLFGYSAAEAVGRPITILIPPDRLEEEPEILRRIRRGERIEHFETVRLCKDGTLLDISLSISPIVDGGGKIVGASKIARDITERRALERQKDAFIGIAAHELRTPVTGIKGYTQLLTRRLERLGNGAAEPLARLNAQVDRLMSLIDDLLDVTRIESDKLLLRYAPFDLNLLVSEVADEVQRTADQHQIIRELGEPVTLEADRERVGQVLTNLLTNAIKYSPRADRVVVRTTTTRDGDEVVISVQDFGIGIPRHEQAHIFERFYRIDDEARAGISGIGLGLYVAAEFVKRHGGRIWVESEVGQGTTVSFSLPLAGPVLDQHEPPAVSS